MSDGVTRACTMLGQHRGSKCISYERGKGRINVGKLLGECAGARVVKFQPNVTTEHQVRIRDTYKTSRSTNECLCSESGARLDGQGWRQEVY